MRLNFSIGFTLALTGSLILGACLKKSDADLMKKKSARIEPTVFSACIDEFELSIFERFMASSGKTDAKADEWLSRILFHEALCENISKFMEKKVVSLFSSIVPVNINIREVDGAKKAMVSRIKNRGGKADIEIENPVATHKMLQEKNKTHEDMFNTHQDLHAGMVAFGIAGYPLLHVTLLSLNGMDDSMEKKVLDALNEYYKSKEVVPNRLVFGKPDVFGRKKQFQVLNNDAMVPFLEPDLRTRLGEIQPPRFPEFRPHVSTEDHTYVEGCISKVYIVRGWSVRWERRVSPQALVDKGCL